MSTRSWLNLGLAVLVAVLAAVAYLQPGIEPPAEPPRLTALEPAAVTRLRVEAPDQPAVVLEKQAEGWTLKEPLALPANDFRIRTLLEVLEAPSDRQLPVAGLDLARFGLAPSKAVLVLDDLRLELGDTESLSGRRYVRIADTVHLTTDRFYQSLTGGAPSFVHLSPLGPKADPVAIALPEQRFRLDAGRWQIEPDPGEVAADAVARQVEAWRHAQAITVRAYEPPAGAATSVAVTLAGKDTPVRFEVVETPHALILARPEAGVQYHLPTEAASRLLRLEPAPVPAEAAEEELSPEAEEEVTPEPAEEITPGVPEDGDDPLEEGVLEEEEGVDPVEAGAAAVEGLLAPAAGDVTPAPDPQ
jgi:hypothetical protein